ncbi:MAG TPA: hypothetical protein VEH05_15415 [Streptosporangiaceae bacterium]|nr:hypothetical protein [Streptosporangiaceae bacterium]
MTPSPAPDRPYGRAGADHIGLRGDIGEPLRARVVRVGLTRGPPGDAFLFAGSAASAAGGLGMLATGPPASRQAIKFAVLGAATELIAKSVLLQRLGDVAEPYQHGRAGRLMAAAEVRPRPVLSAPRWGVGAGRPPPSPVSRCWRRPR